jgi:predicted CopG family antitoxin
MSFKNIYDNMKKTTIQISHKTQKKLKALSRSDNESYENIILRLIENNRKNNMPEEINYSIKQRITGIANFEIKMNVQYEKENRKLKFLQEGSWGDKLPKETFKNAQVQLYWNKFIEDIKSLIENDVLLNHVETLDFNEKFVFNAKEFKIDNNITVICET